jgi:hypothetical protein
MWPLVSRIVYGSEWRPYSADKPVQSLSGDMIRGRIMRLRYHDRGLWFYRAMTPDENEKDNWRATQQTQQ